MKKLVYTNQSEVASDLREISRIQKDINEVLQVCLELKLPLPTDLEELSQLIADPEAFYERKFIREMETPMIEVFGFRISKKKAYQHLLDVPDLTRIVFLSRSIRDLVPKFEYYSLRGGAIELREDAEKIIIERRSLFAENAIESELYDHLNSIAQSITQVNKIRSKNQSIGLTIDGLSSAFVIDQDGPARVSGDFLFRAIQSLRKGK